MNKFCCRTILITKYIAIRNFLKKGIRKIGLSPFLQYRIYAYVSRPSIRRRLVSLSFSLFRFSCNSVYIRRIK